MLHISLVVNWIHWWATPAAVAETASMWTIKLELQSIGRFAHPSAFRFISGSFAMQGKK